MNEWRSVYDSEEMIQRYDQRLKIVGIRAEERDEVVISMIPHKENESFRILDIGAGMGRFTMKLRERYPNAKIVCLDGSEKMLEVAKSRFKENSADANSNISFVHKDFSNASWVEGLSGKFDVAVSTGAIHHISDVRKKHLFSEIYNLLNNKGYFINGDLLKSRYNVLNTKYYDDIWAHYIQVKTREVLGIQREIEDVKKRMYEALKKEGDKPASVENQIQWLLEAGFRVAECVWKYYLLAVIIGIKSI